MSFEQVAKLQVLAQDVEALVRTETLQLGGVFAAIHAGAEGAALEAVAAKIPPPNPVSVARVLTMAATAQGAIGKVPRRDRGGGPYGRAFLGSQIRRNIGSVVMPRAPARRRGRAPGRARCRRRAGGR